MPVPDFQSIMYPFLSLLQDNKVYSLDRVMQLLTQHFNLTKDDLALKVPSGQQTLFRNRVGWSRSYLQKAGLISYPARAHYQITPLGKEALKMATAHYINISFLKKFDPFKEWEASYKSNGASPADRTEVSTVDEDSETPEVIIGKSINQINSNLEYELLNILRNKTADYFELFVVKLLDQLGYGGEGKGNFEVVGRSGDGGIDGILYQDQLGFEKIYVQAKRWEAKVGSPEIRNFIGAIANKGSNKGVILTVGDFTAEAINTAKENPNYKIVLIDGKRLAELAVQNNIGVQIKDKIEIKEIDLDFFEED
ncbi:restriction endonuclease [uncultured Chryseobacterium sp.]|uniref:restriction endonuclease n=1 Tax=uncultured Chryseobacterium sp. TaxID=259322 RepID=UPI00259117F4|nr:restriction endonuclease [uncultured Chryseobacterium sp.]